MVVQWLRLLTPNAVDPRTNPGQGIRYYMLQLRFDRAKQKTLNQKCYLSYFRNVFFMHNKFMEIIRNIK